MTCSTDAGGWITTGGGFSFTYPVQPWQAQQVSAYTDGIELGAAKPQVGYALGKRGYPDVAALADKYIIAANGLFFQSKQVLHGLKASTTTITFSFTFCFFDEQFPARQLPVRSWRAWCPSSTQPAARPASPPWAS